MDRQNQHYDTITLKEMCGIMQVEVPAALKDKELFEISQVLLRTGKLKKGSAYIMLWDDVDVRLTLNRALKKGAEFIFIGRDRFENSGLDEKDYPVILLDDELAQLGYFFSTIRKSYPATTVEITGTLGKTTAKQFLSTILDSHYKSYCSTGNRNSFGAVAEQIQNNLTDELDVYVQETGAAKPYSVEKSAVMLQPDIFVLLNVRDHHASSYGSFDNLFSDKVSPDKHMSENGVIITNFDDENLANHKFIHKVISFGITTERDVDYRAVNIIEKNGKLDFDIVSADKTVHISTNILGAHNVYNALAAFATGKQLGVPVKKIVKAFSDFRTTGIRQNYVIRGGYHLYMDCYNCAFTSISADLESLRSFTLEPGKKKIAVIGGENGLGASSSQQHYDYGKSIKDYNYDVDYYYFVGPLERTLENLNLYGDGASICDGMIDAGFTNCEYVKNTDELIEKLRDSVEPGDLILFKAQLESDLSIVVDKLFGTSFVADMSYYQKDGETFDSAGFEFKSIPFMDDLSLIEYKSDDSSVEIPDVVDGKPIYRIARRAFIRKSIANVSIGKNIVNIGQGAFYKCANLIKLTIPGNVKLIERGAFRNCNKLEKVVLEEGVIHIAQNAFRANVALKEIVIPTSVKSIENDVFTDSERVVIICEPGSYAESYARENNIRCRMTSLI